MLYCVVCVGVVMLPILKLSVINLALHPLSSRLLGSCSACHAYTLYENKHRMTIAGIITTAIMIMIIIMMMINKMVPLVVM